MKSRYNSTAEYPLYLLCVSCSPAISESVLVSQIMSSVLSSDGKIDPDVMAANATSAALMLSDIPWGGPIGVIRIGRISGQFIVNPSMDEVHICFLVFMKTFTSLF